MKRLLALATVLGCMISARAHRLDEYLQATRLALGLDRIELRMDLTPGAAIIQELLPAMDPDGNGRISRREGNAYAQRVLRDLHLKLDGQPCGIKRVRLTFPPTADMVAGEGTVQLTAVAKIPKLKPGPHEILFRNDHLPNLSVYLVNALLPENKQISITRQERDQSQREYHLFFEVKPPPVWGQ